MGRPEDVASVTTGVSESQAVLPCSTTPQLRFACRRLRPQPRCSARGRVETGFPACNVGEVIDKTFAKTALTVASANNKLTIASAIRSISGAAARCRFISSIASVTSFAGPEAAVVSGGGGRGTMPPASRTRRRKPAALESGADGEFYAALHDGTIKCSDDGRTWIVRAAR
jgi:hypothetical protein